MIKKLASGIYSILPIGLRVFKKLETIIRQSLDEVGASEVLMPAIIPSELWKKSKRWDVYGPELLRIKDRHEREFCFGPTHEEVITDIVSASCNSYKQLPICLYQIQTKFRDEIRPRFGVMRSREFSMKDAYSFHETEECLDTTYKQMQSAYQTIFSRCGLSFKMVEADSGAIGGDVSAEFMVTAETGEDVIVECPECQFAANQEVIEKIGVSIGDPCHVCSQGKLRHVRGIEVGHIFKLGDKYSQSMSATFLNREGKQAHFIMGCYGIGVGRTIAAAIEQNHDEKGIIWPVALAPFHVSIIVVNQKRSELSEMGERLYLTLNQNGVEVLYDDREVSTGIKFKDVELLGIPYYIIIGKDSASSAKVEVVMRQTAEKIEIEESLLLSYLQGVVGTNGS